MAITLGTLLIELKANTAQFLDGMTKAATNARATGRDIQTGLSKAGELFAPLGEMGEKLASVFNVIGGSARGAISEMSKSGALVGGLATLTGGAAALGGTLFALAEKAAETGSKIYEASEKTGISASQMSGLMAITKETGGNFDALTTSLARAGANLQKAIIDPGGQTGKVLTQVMGGMKQLAAEGAKPMGDRLQDVLKHIFEMNNVGERNVALSALLGRGWMENVSALKILAEQGYGPAILEAQRLGIFFDTASAQQARNYKVALADITAKFSGMGLAIGQKVIPYMSDFLQHLVSTLPYLEAVGMRMLAIQAAMTGVGIPLAIKLWKEAGEKFKEVDQIETDFLVHINSLVKGLEASAAADGKLAGALKTHHDALAALISRETEQLALLNTNGNKVQQLKIEYGHTVEEIQKLVAAGGSFKEGLAAQGLALDIYKKKLMDIAAIFPQVGRDGWAQLMKQPALTLPTKLPFEFETPKVPSFESSTPAGLADSSRDLDKTRLAEKALRLEADLSKTSLEKLSDAFKGLTNSQIAALPSGQRMIELLSKLDKVGSFSDQFKEMTDQMIVDGGNFGGNMLKIVGGAIDKIEDKFAEMVVKGRINFRDLERSMEEAMVKAAIQKGVSVGLSGIEKLFGGKGGVSKADGSQGSPFYVVMANKVGGLIGGATGQGIAKPLGTLAKDAGVGGGAGDGGNAGAGGGIGGMMSSMETGFSSIFSNLAKSLGSLLKGFGSIFGGFLAEGGDVTPGKAYIVGEHRAEAFVPRMAGHVVPSVSSQPMHQQVTTVHIHVNGVQDADSFRKSQSQIAGEMYRAMAMAHARSNS